MEGGFAMKQKVTLTVEFLELLATSEFVTAYHYRVLILLLTGVYTQSQLADKLQMKRQNVHRCIKDLESHGYIEVDRIEGRNKFLKATTSVKKILQTTSDIQGQLKLM